MLGRRACSSIGAKSQRHSLPSSPGRLHSRSRSICASAGDQDPQAAAASDSQPQKQEQSDQPRTARSRDTNDWQVGGLTTGFPVPLSYLQAVRRWRLSSQGRQSSRRADEEATRSQSVLRHGADVQPVFRAAPYRAERERIAHKTTTTRLLFIDEGNLCRSVLAEAMFKRLLASTRMQLDVSAESASIGPAADGPHDARVSSVAREAGLPLPARSPRVFNELNDIVHYDLVLVMDKFDLEAVLREVAVFDKINPGGHYAARVKQLGSYAAPGRAMPLRPAPSDKDPDINDPLWGNLRGEEDVAALWRLLRQLRLSCKGLLTHLMELDSRFPGNLTFGIAEALSSAAPDQSSLVPSKAKVQQWRPVWQETLNGEDSSLYTIRMTHGKRNVIKRPVYSVERGYWQDLKNVQTEVRRWVSMHGTPDSMPTSRQLRVTGNHSLAAAITKHGGHQSVAQGLGLTCRRNQKGYWYSKQKLEQALKAFCLGQKHMPALPNPASECEGSSLLMPSLKDLTEAGRHDLTGAVQLWGGVRQVAAMLGLGMKYKAKPRKRKLGAPQVLEELQAAMPAACVAGYFPTRQQLLGADQHELVYNIQRLGGFKRVAAQLGLKYRNATCHIHPAAMHSADQDPEGSEQAPDSANEQPPSAGPDAQPVPGAPFFWRSGELAAASEDAILTLRSWREEELQPLGLHSKQKRPLELVSAGSRSGEA